MRRSALPTRGSGRLHGGPFIVQPQLVRRAFRNEVAIQDSPIGADRGSSPPARDGTPRDGVPSAVIRPGLPGVLSVVVAPGQARHDRSTSGLPARGCPMGSRWSSDSRSSTCLHVYPRLRANETLDFRAKQEIRYLHPPVGARVSPRSSYVRRPARTASQICSPCVAPATMASEQCPIHSPSPSGVPVPYAARAPR